MVQQIEPSPTLFHNPAYYLASWEAKGWLSQNALLAALTNTSGPPVATGRLLFIRRSGGSNTPPFATPASASNTINAAITTASEGDTLLILDQQSYPEAVVIEKPISLTSIGTSATTSQSPDYPTLDGQGTRRPITIRNVNTGIAHVSKLRIVNGRADTGRQDGGGILVERTSNSVISSCIVRNCQAPGTGKALQLFAEGFGGGISTYYASPAIVGCLIEQNHANGRGMGIGIYGYGWPAVFDCNIINNTPKDFEGATRGEGGGIGIQVSVTNIEDPFQFAGTTKSNLSTRWNSADLNRATRNMVRIVRCRILQNQSLDDGGGVYISVRSRVFMNGCEIRSNKTPNDGGGIRLTMGSELHLVDCNVSSNEANLAGKSAGGGGISSRNPKIMRLERTILENNIVHEFAGGGLYFISSDEGEIGAPGADFDWNDILVDIFGYRQAVLTIDEASSFRSNKALPGDSGKGGALYVLRFKGARRSGLGDLAGPWGPGGSIVPGAAPISVRIADVNSLKTSNDGSFPNADRLYLDDRVAGPPPRDDTSLPASGAYRYP
jgi:hypothetical protein